MKRRQRRSCIVFLIITFSVMQVIPLLRSVESFTTTYYYQITKSSSLRWSSSSLSLLSGPVIGISRPRHGLSWAAIHSASHRSGTTTGPSFVPNSSLSSSLTSSSSTSSLQSNRTHLLSTSTTTTSSSLISSSNSNSSSSSGGINTTTTTTTTTATCQYCSKSFTTRNELFRHLRNDPECSMKHHHRASSTTSSTTSSSFNLQPGSPAEHVVELELIKESVAFLIGYIDTTNCCNKDDDTDDDNNNDHGDNRNNYGKGTTMIMSSSRRKKGRNIQVGEKIQQLLVETFQDVVHTTTTEDGIRIGQNPLQQQQQQQQLQQHHHDGSIQIVSSTQTSVAKLRHSLLTQEMGCSSVGDVMTVKLILPKNINQIGIWKYVMERMTQRLLQEEEGHHDDDVVHNNNVRLLAGRLMDSRFHAERSCTQRIYHYLLPLSWLPDGDQVEEWWRQPGEADDTHNVRNSPHNQKIPNNNHSWHHIFAKKLTKPPPSLRRLKSALRSAESSKVRMDDIRSDTNQPLRVASKRYGMLAGRVRRAWHSFTSPDLCGDASPNNEPVWRVVDKARIVGFVEDTDDDDNPQDVVLSRNSSICAIVEITGDDFVPEQIRRIVASAVAMSHGWLPDDFFALSTSVNTILDTPLAPPGRLYVAGSRFHFDELAHGGLPFFEEGKNKRIIQSWNVSSDIEIRRWIQKELLRRKGRIGEVQREAEWLSNLCECTCPKIRQRIEESRDDVSEFSLDGNHWRTSFGDSDLPATYKPVLSELRRILSDGEWPETSVARSSVILPTSEEDVTDSRRVASGSFTIVNPLVENTLETTLPVANTLFPRLVEDVFKLEQVLSHQKAGRVERGGLVTNVETGRPASSHCAVNCNAQFTPHVDTGVGAGQKLSMIVGLGDYAGGELFVEGEKYDIRYKPIEFDGCKLRHWTARFTGERFSLVWFTPETKRRN